MTAAVNQLGLARMIARAAHWEQVDRLGDPYFLHPMAVASLVASRGGTEEQVVAAILHDATEDSDLTPVLLVSLGVSEEAAEMVRLLDRKAARAEGRDYYASLRGTPALLVKDCDIRHNTDPRRVARLSPADQVWSAKRYERARRELGLPA